jgi:peptidyl-dipeptidase Dcp
MPEEIVMRHRFRNSDIFFQAMDMLQGITAIYGLMYQHGCVRGFTEGDGPYDKEVAKRLYESVFVGYRSRRCLVLT